MKGTPGDFRDRSRSNAEPKPPQSKVVVSGGKVVRIEEWCLLGMTPTNTMLITRDDQGEITCLVNDPEHGSFVGKGLTPEEAVGQRFNPNMTAKYIIALKLQNPTALDLRWLFPRYQLDIQ